jgi:hypothetical protein
MPTQKPPMTEHEDRVVKFRPRPAGSPIAPAKDAAPDTQARDDDYRQRLIANLAAAAFAVILTAVGVWLANSLTHMRQAQDCMAMGLRDCSRITGDAPHS